MTTKEIISGFARLGEVMKTIGKGKDWPGYEIGITSEEFNDLVELIKKVKHRNAWFTEDFVRKSFAEWGNLLNEEQLVKWRSNYPDVERSKKVGIVMAGNLPIVGFHDLLSVVILNHIALVKMSSDDDQLIPALLKVLYNFVPSIEQRISLVAKLEGYDAVIATGSNNTSRYFESYFGHVPNVIRKNRTSVAIVTNATTNDQLSELGRDVFDYYGLGCRNVTKVYFEKGFELDRFFKAIYSFSDIINMNKYANNYDYHKALFLMNKEPFLENGFLMLKESPDYYSPIGVLYYEFFEDKQKVQDQLNEDQEQIQCIVSSEHIAFGKSQAPALSDYADGVDTLKFLTGL